MSNHNIVGTNNLAKARGFYAPVMAALGHEFCAFAPNAEA